MTSTRTTGVVAGVLFLSAFLLYGVGSSLATTSAIGSPALGIGVALMLMNSAAVIAIGVLLLPVLRPHSRAIAYTYLAARVIEGAALAAGAVALLRSDALTNTIAFNAGMAVLGLGSVFFCAVLYRARLVPKFLAAWGFIGYAIFGAGSLLELAGVTGAGIVGAIPGGLFELAFGVWLLVRGFGPSSRRVPSSSSPSEAEADADATLVS